MKNQTPENYIYENFPIKNPVLYCLRVFIKIFFFVFFGIGTICLSILIFPIMKLIFRDKLVFQKNARKIVSKTFKFFLFIIKLTGALKISIDNTKKISELKAGIVVANHPSLIDVVILISQISNADAIVNSNLAGKNIVHFIINALYITNNLPHDELIKKCVESLHNGNVLIIFPEGTRSTCYGQNQYKKGAARIAIASGCPIVPIFIGGNNKVGLGKKESMFSFNHTGPYIYNLCVKETINPQEFSELKETVAAKRITDKIKNSLSYENNMDKLIGINKKNPLFNY